MGKLSVVMEPWGVNAPLAGVIAYWETLAELVFATNNQFPSPRMAMEFGVVPVGRLAGLSVDNAPVTGLILKPERVFDNVSTT